MPAAAAPRKPVSAVAKGAYYKSRTRKWLTALGWQQADLEVVRWIYTPKGDRIPQKFDQFGSDLLGMTCDRIVFIQVKGGKSCRGGIADARRGLLADDFPSFAERWIVLWPFRARHPNVIAYNPQTEEWTEYEQAPPGPCAAPGSR